MQAIFRSIPEQKSNIVNLSHSIPKHPIYQIQIFSNILDTLQHICVSHTYIKIQAHTFVLDNIIIFNKNILIFRSILLSIENSD
jgi:hypothetical protein